MTYFESLFSANVMSGTTAGKRLMIVIQRTREAYKRPEISNIKWIRSKFNVDYGLTKLLNCDALDNVLQTERLDIKIEQ